MKKRGVESLEGLIWETWGDALEKYHGSQIPSHKEVFRRAREDLAAHQKERQFWVDTGTLGREEERLRLEEVSEYVAAFTAHAIGGTVTISDFLDCLEELEIRRQEELESP